MANAITNLDAPAENFSRKMDSGISISNTEMASFQSGRTGTDHQAKNNGKDILPGLSLIGDNEPSVTKPQKDLPMDAETPVLMGHIADRALQSGNVKDMARAQKDAADIAASEVRLGHGGTTELDKFSQSLNDNIKANNKGIFFETNGDTVTTHMAQQLDPRSGGDAIIKGDQSVHFNKELNLYYKDLVAPLTTEVHAAPTAGTHEHFFKR